MTTPSKNGLFVLAAFIIGAFINYVYNVSMGWLLTPEQYGMLGVSISFLIILSLFVTSAFPLTVTKFISGEHEEFIKHRVFKSSLTANLIIAVIISALFYFSYNIGIIDLGADYNLLVICIILATTLTAASVIYQSILQGTFRFKFLAAIGIITIFVKLISGVILVKMGLGAFGALLSLPISAFVCLILAIILTMDFKFWKTDGWADSSVYFFALPMFFGTLGTTLLMNIDIIGVKFLTDGLMSDALSGYYRAALILAQLPIFVVGALMSVLFPYISKHNEDEKYPAKSIKYAALFILPISLALATIPEAFISLMFPPAYIAGAQALGIVALGMGFLAMVIVFTNIFQARHAPKIPAIVLSIAVIIEILSLIVLVPSYGTIGAATSTTIACAFGFIVLAALYMRTYRAKLNHITILKTLVSFSIVVSMIYTLPHSTSISFIADLLISGAVYFVSLAIFGLLTEEDMLIFLSGLPNHKKVNWVAGKISSFIKMFNKL